MNEDFSDPSWRVNLLYDLPERYQPRGVRITPPTTDQLKDELNRLDQELRELDSETDGSQTTSSSGQDNNPSFEENMQEDQELLKKAEKVRDELTSICSSLDLIFDSTACGPSASGQMVSIPENVIKILEESAATFKMLDEVSNSLHKLPLDDWTFRLVRLFFLFCLYKLYSRPTI